MLNDKNNYGFFEQIVDNSNNEIFIFDSETLKFTYANKKALLHLGYNLEELQEMTPVDIKPEYTQESFLELIQPLFEATLNASVFETFYKCKNGDLYSVEIRLELIRVDSKKHFVILAHDITKRKEALQRLKDSEEKFRKIFETTLVGVCIYKEYILYANDAFLDISGYELENLQALHPWDLLPDEYKDMLKAATKRRLKGEEFPRTYNDVEFVRKDGKKRVLRVLNETITHEGTYAGLATIVDITDASKTKKQLKLLAQAIEQTDELIRITDKDGVITYVNDAFVAHTGYRGIELIGKKNNILKSEKHNRKFYKELWDTISSGKTYRGIFINKKKYGHLYYEEQTITPIIDDNGVITHYVGTGQDITLRVEIEERLQKLATTDSLTGIANRYKINLVIDEEIERGKVYGKFFTLVMFDIDKFKNINDTYGHDVGDMILSEVSELIEKYIRDTDSFGRWGGEEFMLVLHDTQEDEAISIAQKIRKVIEIYPFKVIEHLTVSIGVSSYKKDASKESLLKRADNALYRAKRNGRNCVIVE